ncbi:MAG: phosphate/phosphite/phosphonate ABC transporter substrate-binding protein [Candidatus Cloacimonetes bacterium]|jgi:phosphonate transport system substrate-binding protein|nr:phosphate/phosphite/phosphonate ABC transporter substrate-binding protein [Candidatus Cloacimonadota bacterium]MDD2505890.1 phosphate/phosphite/phosphonate ABC transporter substrate-binding protein [Candidatus Cloacimonadota bacterium]MDD4560144.1 phosphate/phosphite/phosphonate ABC transporter substrate-binding protein [Candidatus Cloacimonadota bacterium]
MKRILLILAVALLLLTACQSESARISNANKKLGTRQNPIKMYFVPSLEAGKVVASGEAIAEALHKAIGYHFKVAVPTSYAAVIEALGTYQADIAWLPTYAYVLAKQKYDANVRLMTVRNGLNKYRGQFVAMREDIKSLEDIEGKIIAYTDAASTSGYIYPSAILKEKGIEPKEHIFAGGHPQAILAVYSGRADVACSYWSPADSTGMPMDAREKLYETHKDIFEKVRIIGFTDWIPNDTVTFRRNLPEELEKEVVKALYDFAQTPEGRSTLKSLYDVDGLEHASDADYDVVRNSLKAMNMDPETMLK